MKVLLVGVGTVGEAIARLSRGKPWLETMVLADYDIDRAARIAAQVGDGRTHPHERIDASDASAVEGLARKHRVDLVMNAVDPSFVMPIFDGAFAAGVDYMDMAVSLSEPHPTDPHSQPGVKLGDGQFAKAKAWEERGRPSLRPVTQVPTTARPTMASPSVAGSGVSAATTSRGDTSTPFTRTFLVESSPSRCSVRRTSMNSSPKAYLKVTLRGWSQRGTSSTSSCSTWTHSMGPMPSGKMKRSAPANGSRVYQPRSLSQTTGGLRHSSMVVQMEKTGAKG